MTRPGYYAVPPDAMVAMVLNAAGGPTRDAEMKKLKLDRAGKTLWQGDEFRRAIAEGRTLDQLRVQGGVGGAPVDGDHPEVVVGDDRAGGVPVLVGLGRLGGRYE